ncbi:tyrosine-type recombinase/integrase [Rhodosalinus sp. FB01]|uniref:tyrosine-type recombinase/integrase n=1 Tax=Rhodosalinus sp. FB01 TaxID=3239194 RepID=UPI003525A865
MPKSKKFAFTLARLRALEPEGGVAVWWDTEQPGLGCRVARAKDGKVMRRLFAQVRVVAGAQRKITLCDVVEVHSAKALANVREDVAEYRRQAKRGVDPVEERKIERAAAEIRAAEDQRVEEFAETFLTHPKGAGRHADGGAYARYAIGKLVTALGATPVREIELEDLERLQADLARRLSGATVNRIFSDVSKFFTLAKKLKLIKDRPTVGLEYFEEAPREEVLSIDEMKAFWRALDVVERNRQAASGTPVEVFVDAIRLLCLTGARRNEALGARFEEFDLTPRAARWKRPALRMKARKASDVPLSEPVAEIVRRAKARQKSEAWASRNPYVFPAIGRGEPKHITHLRGVFLATKDVALLGERDFRLHDIRATFATRLITEAELPPALAAKLTAHAAPAGDILQRTYLRVQDEPRLREALDVVAEAWGATLEPRDNVVALAR